MIQAATRLLTLLVCGFAIMGFIAVPVFEKTGLQHVLGFFDSKPAQAATAELGRSLSDVHEQIENELAQRSDEDSSKQRSPEEVEAPAALSRKVQRKRRALE